MAPDNEKLLCHVASLACATHASRVAHLAVEHKSSTLVFLCGSGMDRKKERKKARTAAVGGGDRAAPEHHTDRSLWKERIARARLLSCHILIPGWAHLGTDLHRAPWQRDPPPPNTHTPTAIQACSCQHFHLCTVLVWCQVHTHTPKPPQQLACLMSVKTNRWGGEREQRGG